MQLEGIRYVRAYYTGMPLVHPDAILRYEIMDPPCSGEQGALILEPNDQGKKKKKTDRLTLFCPFTLQSYMITPEAGELHRTKMLKVEKPAIEGIKETRTEVVKTKVKRPETELTEEKVDRLARIITENWERRCRLSLGFDLDIAALVLARMGKPIPEARPTVKKDSLTGEAKKSGKPAADALIKPVKAESKPGRVLAFYLGSRKSIQEGMAEFGATRSALQSNLYGLWKDNGIGYSLSADMVDIILPKGCKDPFSMTEDNSDILGDDAPKPAAKPKAKGKPMQDELLQTPLPEKGKRREVALATYKGWTSIKEIAEKLQCSEGSVRSHLNDLHLKHGYGFEIDGDKARLLVPKGWKP